MKGYEKERVSTQIISQLNQMKNYLQNEQGELGDVISKYDRFKTELKDHLNDQDEILEQERKKVDEWRKQCEAENAGRFQTIDQKFDQMTADHDGKRENYKKKARDTFSMKNAQIKELQKGKLELETKVQRKRQFWEEFEGFLQTNEGKLIRLDVIQKGETNQESQNPDSKIEEEKQNNDNNTENVENVGTIGEETEIPDGGLIPEEGAPSKDSVQTTEVLLKPEWKRIIGTFIQTILKTNEFESKDLNKDIVVGLVQSLDQNLKDIQGKIEKEHKIDFKIQKMGKIFYLNRREEVPISEERVQPKTDQQTNDLHRLQIKKLENEKKALKETVLKVNT